MPYVIDSDGIIEESDATYIAGRLIDVSLFLLLLFVLFICNVAAQLIALVTRLMDVL